MSENISVKMIEEACDEFNHWQMEQQHNGNPCNSLESVLLWHLEQISTLKAELEAEGETIVGLMREREILKAEVQEKVASIIAIGGRYVEATKKLDAARDTIATLQDEKDGVRECLNQCQCAIQGYKDTNPLNKDSVLNKALVKAKELLASTQPSPRGVKFDRMEKALKEIIELEMGQGDGVVGDYIDDIKRIVRAAIPEL